MEYKDNILGNNTFAKLQATLLNEELPWFFIGSTAYTDQDPTQEFDFSFAHQVYKEGKVYSSLGQFLETCCLSALDNAGITCKELWRIRLGLITATKQSIVHQPHVDYEEPHKSALIYVNDTDGDTVFYKNKFVPGTIHSAEWKQSFEEDARVTPKANRLVWFDGLQYHSSSTPTQTSRRIVINFNYV